MHRNLEDATKGLSLIHIYVEEEGQAEMPGAAEAEPKAGAEQMAPETGEAIADMEQLAQETGEAEAGAGYAAPVSYTHLSNFIGGAARR